MAYTAKCTGTYIGQFTMYNPVDFNRALNEGYSVKEATQLLKTGNVIFASAFYPLFSYTVDGVKYIRASYRLHEHFGRSIGSANMWMRGKECTVCYDPYNPGDAVIEDRSGMAEADDVEPDAPKRASVKWLWIIVGVFAALSIVQFIMHAILFLR